MEKSYDKEFKQIVSEYGYHDYKTNTRLYNLDEQEQKYFVLLST